MSEPAFALPRRVEKGTPPSMSRLDRLRTWLLWLHLLVGLLVAVPVTVMALTGFSLAFARELTAWAESGVVPAAGEPLAPTVLVSRIEAARPGSSVRQLILRADPKLPAVVALAGEAFHLVDPTTGALLSESTAREALHAIEEIHTSVALELVGLKEAGKELVGWVATGLFLLAFSGLWLWWPRGKAADRFRRITFPMRTDNPRLREWSWHHASGFWAAPVLLTITLTGFTLCSAPLKAWLEGRFGAVPTLAAGEAPPSERFDLDVAFQAVRERVPGWQSIGVRLPVKGPLVNLRVQTGEGVRPTDYVRVAFDSQSGALRTFAPYERWGAGSQVIGWARWLHTGQALGLLGQLAAALAMVAVTVLVWSGLSLGLRRVARTVRRR